MRKITCLNLHTLLFLFLLCFVTIIIVPEVYATESNNFYIKTNGIIDSVGNSDHSDREFAQYKLVTPIVYNKRHQKEITRKIKNLFHHPDLVTIFLPNDQEELVLDLTLNKPLISEDYFIKTQKDGVDKITKPLRKNSKFCHYTGKVRNKAKSWVALSTCDGLSGVIYDGANTYYLERKNTADNEHFLYKHQDLIIKNVTSCGNKEKYNIDTNQSPRYRRDAPEENNQIKEPYNSDSETRYVELVLVVDHQKYVELNSSLENVEQYCKSIVNIMNGIYSSLNIVIALSGVVVWTENDQIKFSEDGDKTLENFLLYRKKKLLRQHPNDNAQLITKKTFTNGVVGKALKGPICTAEYSGGLSSDSSSVIGLVATSVAHMLGHNFGMEHDSEDCDCPDKICIMSSRVSSNPPTRWSSCSRKFLQSAFEHGMDHCLKNIPKSLYHGPVCGNGFVEDDEECDCGQPEHCKNKCCNATTCKLLPEAKCATGKCCDLKTCTLKNTGVRCRKAISECDLSEYCTGKSEYCPADVFRLNGEICEDGKGHCYQGRCGSKSQQCKLLWGPTGTPADDRCYSANLKGNRHGNCGYDKLNETYVTCDDQDIMCGSLFCRHLSHTLEYGLESVSILSHIYFNYKGQIIPCRNVIVDLGVDHSDPGMVPNGSPCGTGKMCLKKKCVSISSVQEGRTCPNNCSNSGYCDSLGHCHCEGGFLLPECRYL